MNSDDSISSRNTEDDLAWARNGLGFELGVSTWRDRVAAIVHGSGSRGGAATLLNASLHDIKNWLNKARNTPAPREPQQIADAAGLSLSYVVSGTPRIPRDFEVELDRLSKLKSEFVPTGTTAARRAALRQVVEQLRDQIEAARAEAAVGTSYAVPVITKVLARVAGLSDQADGLFVLPTLTTRLGEAALSDEPSPLAFSHEWLVRQRLDPADLGVVAQRDGLYLVDTSTRARALADGCLYAVIDGDTVAICQWRRRAEGGGELVLLHPSGLDPRRNPADIVGRVVYELAAR